MPKGVRRTERNKRSLTAREFPEEARARAIEALKNGLSMVAAADAAGVSRVAIWKWRRDDEEFAKQVEDAIEAGTDRLEDEAYRRARGWNEPVFNKDGDPIGEKFNASDRLMEFMLSGRRPEKFRPVKTAITVNNNQTNQTLNALMTPEVSALLENVAQAKASGFDRGKGEA